MAYSSLLITVILLYAGWWTRWTDAESCSNGDIRLADKVSFLEGRIELCQDNRWGTVCDDQFDSNDANVACKQLGFSNQGAEFKRGSRYGRAVGPILLNELQCCGREDSLFECLSDSTKLHSCEHDEDAGVKCKQPEGVLIVLGRRLLSNNSIVHAEDIGLDMGNSVLQNDSNALLCITDKTSCCSNETGNWYLPNGSIVPTDNETTMYTNRVDDQSVRLNYPGGSFVPGVYRCEVPDQNSVMQNVYIGIYSNSTSSELGNISISDLSYNEETETVVCTTSGGPATTVVWSKDNVVLDVNNSPKYDQSQVVIDSLIAVYENRLTLMEKSAVDLGRYSCEITNARNTDNYSIAISVCKDGETRSTLQEVLMICSRDAWYSLSREVLVTRETQSMTDLTLHPNSTSVTFALNLNTNFTKYEMKCSTNFDSISKIVSFSESGRDQHKHESDLNLIPTTHSIFGLTPSTQYHCCVTLFYDVQLLHGLNEVHTECSYTTTIESSETNIPECPNQPANSDDMSWLIIVLGVMMILSLLVLVVVVAAWVASCAKKTTSWPVPQNTSMDEVERNVTNPIYNTHTVTRQESIAANPIYGSGPPSPTSPDWSLDTKDPTYAAVDDFVKKDVLTAAQNHYSTVTEPAINNPVYERHEATRYAQLKRNDSNGH